jgi:hypothetical protein
LRCRTETLKSSEFWTIPDQQCSVARRTVFGKGT